MEMEMESETEFEFRVEACVWTGHTSWQANEPGFYKLTNDDSWWETGGCPPPIPAPMPAQLAALIGRPAMTMMRQQYRVVSQAPQPQAASRQPPAAGWKQDKTKSVNVLSDALVVAAAALTRFGYECEPAWLCHHTAATVRNLVGGRITFIHISADPRRVHFFF